MLRQLTGLHCGVQLFEGIVLKISQMAPLKRAAKLLRRKDWPSPFSCLMVTGTVMLTLL